MIDAPVVRLTKLKEGPRPLKLYDFEQLDRLVLAAERSGNPDHRLTVRLGGEAGLRVGEMRGLQWSDVNLKRGTVTVCRAIWRDVEGRPREVVPEPSTSPRGFSKPSSSYAGARVHRPVQPDWDRLWDARPRDWLTRVQRDAGFLPCGPHTLWHTFCSHLAVQGVPPRFIQVPAGHQSMATTERYMHLAPHAMDDVVDRLARPPEGRHRGDGSGGPDSPQSIPIHR